VAMERACWRGAAGVDTSCNSKNETECVGEREHDGDEEAWTASASCHVLR